MRAQEPAWMVAGVMGERSPSVWMVRSLLVPIGPYCRVIDLDRRAPGVNSRAWAKGALPPAPSGLTAVVAGAAGLVHPAPLAFAPPLRARRLLTQAEHGSARCNAA